MTSVEIEPGVTRYVARFHFDILYSGLKSLRIDVPATLADKIRHDNPAIQRSVIEPAPEDLAEGYVAWQFSSESEFTKGVDIQLKWDENSSALDVGKSHSFQLPILTVHGADRSWGQIVIGKGENLDVQPSGEPKGLRPIDPQHDLAIANPIANAARAFEFHDAWSLELTATRYELEQVKRTNVEQAVIRMVVTRHGQTAVQRCIESEVPSNGWQSSCPSRSSWMPHRCGLTARKSLWKRGIVTSILFRCPEATFPRASWSSFAIPPTWIRHSSIFPQFPGDPATQKIYLCVFLPRELALLKHSGPWSDELRSDWQSVFFNVVGHDYTDEQLITQLTRGLSSKAVDTNFPRSGRLMVFSTLQPAPPPDGSLRLVTMSKNLINALLFATIGLIGVGFYWQPFGRKMFAIGAIFVAAILSGCSLLLLLDTCSISTSLIAVAAVLIVWLMRHFSLSMRSAQRPAQAAVAAGAANAVAQLADEASGGVSFISPDAERAVDSQTEPAEGDSPNSSSDDDASSDSSSSSS